MWDTPFDESMLQRNTIIYCPNESLVDELMETLERNGITWYGDEPPTSDSRWDEVTRPTFMEAHYNELMRFARIASWSGEARQVVSTPPVEDTELTAEDTKELDEFLSSFSRT